MRDLGYILITGRVVRWPSADRGLVSP